MSWNRPSNAPQPPSKKSAPSLKRGILAGLAVVVLGAGLVAWFLTNGEADSRPLQKKDRGLIKEVKSAKSPKLEVAEKKGRVKPKTAEDILQNLETLPKPTIKKRELTPGEWDTLTNRPFNSGVEQLMAWLFTVKPGETPVPIPPISEEERNDLVSILISKNPVKDGDSEKLAFAKEQIALAKKEMAKYIGDGGDPDDFLQYYFEELRLACDKRIDAVGQLQEAYQEDPEIAEAMRKKVNEAFEEKGIKLIDKEEME